MMICLSMYITNAIPHEKCFVRYLRTRLRIPFVVLVYMYWIRASLIWKDIL